MTKEFVIPVSWSVATDLTVEAESLEKAIEKVKKMPDLPKDYEYIDGSFEVDLETAKELNQANEVSHLFESGQDEKNSIADAGIIQKMLVISTAHIREETGKWLSQASNFSTNGLVIYKKSKYGFLILVLDEDDLESEEIPEDLLQVIKFAQSIECDWVMLDYDAPKICELQTYEW